MKSSLLLVVGLSLSLTAAQAEPFQPIYDRLKGSVQQQSLKGSVQQQSLKGSVQQNQLRGLIQQSPKKPLPFDLGAEVEQRCIRRPLRPETPESDVIKPPKTQEPLPYPGPPTTSVDTPPVVVGQTDEKWRLYSEPDLNSGTTICPAISAKMVYFGDYTVAGTDPNTLGACISTFRMMSWNKWAARVLHMVYANLQTFPGDSSGQQATIIHNQIFIRRDGSIHVLDWSGQEGNEGAVRKSCEALQGRPELKFPALSMADTVRVPFIATYGRRLRDNLQKDSWGRTIPTNQSDWWNYKEEW